MLINLRNALMAGKRLPYDAEVEYLESSGTQYIDTLVNADSNLSVEITMANAGTPWTNVGPMGAILTTPRRRHHLTFTSAASINYYLGNNDSCYVASGYKPADGEIFTFKVDAVIKTFTLGSYLGTFPNDTFDTGLSYWLFGRNGTTPPYLCSLRIYSTKLWNGSTLVRDFIPVRKGTVGYLYDRVTRKLFGNAGTGDFVLGPDVVPVEYIESHGTEWIDTGLIWDPLKWECIADITATQKISENYIISQYGSGQGVVYAFAYMHGSLARLAYRSNAADSFLVDSDFFGTKHTWHAIYENGNQKLDIGDNIHLSSTESYVAGQSESAMRIIIGGMQTYGGHATGVCFGNVIINHDSNPSRSFFPVRVGTGSTWEGAMMDVLTRRIYRNAGTGAFTYGNDLKYPIPAE